MTFDPMFLHLRFYFNKTIQNVGYRWGCRSVVEHLPTICGTLSEVDRVLCSYTCMYILQQNL